MVIFAGKFICGTAWELQSRILLISWTKNCCGIGCSKGRLYCSSSFPKRYIPKNSSKPKELQGYSTMKRSGNNTDKRHHPDTCAKVEFLNVGESSNRISSHCADKSHDQNQQQKPINNLTFDAKLELVGECDSGIGLMNYDFEEEPALVAKELENNLAGRSSQQNDIDTGCIKQEVEKLAVELLAKRAYTAVELKKKLQGKRFPHGLVDSVVTEFQSRGLINDGLYAETFSRSRWSSSTWGPRRIKLALSQKGVSEVDAENAIKLVFKDGQAGEDQVTGLGMSNLSLDHLFVQASKQWLRGRDVPRDTRVSRIIRWLQYRGFNWGVISFVLKRLESEYPP